MGVPKEFGVLCLTLLIAVNAQQQPYKLCAQQKDNKDCEQLARSDKVACLYNLHNIDCILDIEQGKIDFGRIAAEEALVAANFVKDIVVLGEFRSDAIYDDSEYATVVLVRSNFTGGLKDFRGKKYCHPGFKFDEFVTELVLKEFESAVLKANGAEGCNNKVESNTLLEKELKALSEFFGPSCRPGPWIDLDNFDNQFYQRYPKLCELCSSNNKCVVQSGAAPFLQSLECLINGGDVTVTTLNTLYEFFNKTENTNKKSEYKYFCRDGQLSPLDKPCTWSKQPWNLIVANRKQAEFIKTDLGNWLFKYIISPEVTSNPTESEKFVESLKFVLFPEDRQYKQIKFVSQNPSLSDYIKDYRTIPNIQDNKRCNTDLKWCTVSKAEQQKCKWLAQASLNRAIQPTVNCVPSSSKLTCLEDIKNNKADVVTSDAHFGYIARKKNLIPLAYPETDPKNRIKPIVIIKSSDTQNIKDFTNLKAKKACMPEYGGIEWLAFIHEAREKGVLSKTSCDYGELISNFVGESCMPGIHDPEHEKSAKANEDKLCSLCVPDPYFSRTATSCNTDNTNKYYGNVGAIKCLKEAGDFAVISKGVYTEVNTTDYTVLCKNGSLALKPGFDVDDGCVLTTVIDSEVITKKNNSKIEDISIVLLNFERRFGTDRVKAFEVFNIFNHTLDLLFKDSTPGLAPVTSENQQIKNYINLFAHVDNCTSEKTGGTATGLKVTFLPVAVAFVLVLGNFRGL